MHFTTIYKQCSLLAVLIYFGHIGLTQRLYIGDKLPAIELTNVINYPSPSLSLNSLNNRLIILDFWGTGCLSCIEAFPKLDSLQKEYGDKIQIIAINKESRDSTLKFFARFKKIKMPSIPFVSGDSVLTKLFPHNFVPHHVWIDSVKTVRFITYGWNANAKNIRNYLEGINFSLAESPYKENYVIENPIIKELQDQTASFSLITHYVPGVSVLNRVTSSVEEYSQPNRLTKNSSSILQLFVDAFSEGGKLNFSAKNSVILKNIDLRDIDYPTADASIDDWLENNSYNYDLLVPPSNWQNLYKFMQQDLARYFGIDAKVIHQEIWCWELIRTSKMDKIKTEGRKSKYIHHGISRDSIWYAHNLSMNEFTSRLQALLVLRGFPFPLVDNTGYKSNVDIGLDFNLARKIDLAYLKKELLKYDLSIVPKKRKLPTLVLQKR